MYKQHTCVLTRLCPLLAVTFLYILNVIFYLNKHACYQYLNRYNCSSPTMYYSYNNCSPPLMAHARPVIIPVTVLLLIFRYYAAAQDGDCSPSPPSTLINSSGILFGNNVPMINAQADVLQPIVGGHRTDSWAVFSTTQVRQHGLWCQVRLEDTGNTPNSNIGDWYYPTTDTLCFPTQLLIALPTSH